MTGRRKNLIGHNVQPYRISLPFKGRAGVGIGNSGRDYRLSPPIPLQLPLEGGERLAQAFGTDGKNGPASNSPFKGESV